MSDAALQAGLDWVSAQQDRMVGLTERWSRINSGSYNVEGLRAMRAALAEEFAVLGAGVEVLPLGPMEQVDAKGALQPVALAEALSLRKRPDAPVQLLLVGHMDTVYGVDHPFQATKLSTETLNGPGVADLKGGLAVMLVALEALERSPWKDKIGWRVFLNTDEEIGSIGSDPLLQQAAKEAHLGLVYEPALADGTLAGERKGSGNFTIVVRGRAAHAGRNPEEGRNAIVAAAELTQGLFALNGQRPDFTVNPGRIEGGGPLNVVPDLAILRFNVRTQSTEDEVWFFNEVDGLISLIHSRDGFRAERHGFFTRAPKPMHPRNRAAFDMVQQCGRELGLDIGIKPSGGCCDGNNLWKHGLPNVDTLGVRGAHIHSDQEIVYLSSFTERAKLSALLLMRLARGDLVLPAEK